MQHLDEILLVSDIPGSSVAWPAPVTLPGLEMFPLLLVINLLTQLTQVLLLSHLTCQLFPVELLALYISPGLRPATQRQIIPSTLSPLLLSASLTLLLLHLDRLCCCCSCTSVPGEEISVYDPTTDKRMILENGELVEPPEDDTETSNNSSSCCSCPLDQLADQLLSS